MTASRYARVIIDRSIHRELDYLVPETLAERIDVGSRVRVPFREKSALATVVTMLDASDAEGIRPIEAVLGDKPVLSKPLLELARWMSAYYCCPIETVMRSLLPQVIRRGEVGWKKQLFVRRAREISFEDVEKLRRRAPKQAELLEALAQLTEPVAAAEFLRKQSLDNQTLRALVKRGFAVLEEQAVQRDPHADETFIATSNLVLNEEQTAALRMVEEAMADTDSAKPILLHGVTGSGKTEIYLQAIKIALAQGKNAIVLVPEISLTPQTVERFKSRFAEIQDGVAVLHSHLSEGERHDEWHKIHSGRARIVIGARSAVFAPLENLGLIVVDEEHETSYKQEEAPRYHARDVAVVRGKIEKCVVLLGSATPVTGKLLQRDAGKIPARHVDEARGRKSNAAHSHRRFAAGAAQRKRDCHSRRKITRCDHRSSGETRANHSFSESARLFHFIALQQLRRIARLPELQRRAHVSSRRGAFELSFVRTHRGGSKKMSGLRRRRAHLFRFRHGKSGGKPFRNFFRAQSSSEWMPTR